MLFTPWWGEPPGKCSNIGGTRVKTPAHYMSFCEFVAAPPYEFTHIFSAPVTFNALQHWFRHSFIFQIVEANAIALDTFCSCKK